MGNISIKKIQVEDFALLSTNSNDTDEIFEQFIKLIQVIRENKEIGLRVRQLLEMDRYKRQAVLNNWLEQLQTQNASENLLNALSCLFDETLAQKVLSLISYKS